jgi:hypothetical protein
MLNELSPEERAEFEEHMFDCQQCSSLVRDNFTVVGNLKEVLREERQLAAVKAEKESQRSGWRGWLHPSSLAPSAAALAMACVIGYQNFGAGLGQLAPAQLAEVLPQAAALKATSRGNLPIVYVDRKVPVFTMSVKLDTAGPFDCEFDDASGNKLLDVKSGPLNPDLDLSFRLPTRSFPPGHYKLIMRPDSQQGGPVPYDFEAKN